ncbi:MAG: hypothetical protein BWK77_01200 [Verrucomicrobia bacterium A1]|nr:MAG: hypothetical protein BWK77_01200 [Verrucomicrobia bacterium A1]
MKTKRCIGPRCRLRARPYREFDPDTDQPDLLVPGRCRCAAVLAKGPVRVCRICKRPKPLTAFSFSRRPGAEQGRGVCCTDCLAAKRARYAAVAAADPQDRSHVARIAREGPGPGDMPFVRAVFARMLREGTG